MKQYEDEQDDVYYIGTKQQKIDKKQLQLYQPNAKNPKFDNIIANIIDVQSQSFMKIQTQYYCIEIKDGLDEMWMIKRRYSDFEWLFIALSQTFPGYILPYFPQKSIQSFMTSKINIQYTKNLKNQSIGKRRQQLSVFLHEICNHQLVKYSEQFDAFLKQDQQLFKKQKKKFQSQIAQTQISESTSKGFFSYFERGVAWITSQSTNAENIVFEEVPEWKSTEQQIRKWLDKVSKTHSSIEKLMILKSKQIEWKGPDTQIDSVQILKTKVISSRQYNTILIDEVKQNVLETLQKNMKSLKQIQNQLTQREQIIKIILYLRKYNQNQERINKLLRKKEHFQKNLIREFAKYSSFLKKQMLELHESFNNIWQNHCEKMHRIWK